MEKVSVAIDISGPFSCWAIYDAQREVVLDKVVEKVSRRKSTVFFNTLISKLNDFGIKFADISKWYVGNGPGSYTGIRMAAAFVNGVIFYSKASVVTVPTYYSIASAIMPLKKDSNTIAVLFKLSQTSVIAYKLILKDGKLHLLDREVFYIDNYELLLKYADVVVAIDGELDLDLWHKVVTSDNFKIVPYFPIENMFKAICHSEWNRGVKNLIYTRPPAILKNRNRAYEY